MNLFSYYNAFRKVYKEIRVQKKFNQTFLIPYFNELERKDSGKFEDEQRKKIIN